MATSFLGSSGDPHAGKNVSIYSPNVREMIDTDDVLITMTDVQAYKNAMMSPYASFMYVYSPPDFRIIVPSSE